MREILKQTFLFQATQLVDSTLATTRIFWRNKLGFSEKIANDPRPLEQAISARSVARGGN